MDYYLRRSGQVTVFATFSVHGRQNTMQAKAAIQLLTPSPGSLPGSLQRYHWSQMAEIHDINGSRPLLGAVAGPTTPPVSSAQVIQLRQTESAPPELLSLSPEFVKARTAQSVSDTLVQTILRDHSESMFRLAKSIVRDNALAEDVVQESVLKAWQASESFRGDSSLRSWVLRITHNTAISLLRKRREDYREPDLVPEVPDALGQTDRQVHGRLMVNDLWVAIGALDPVSRSITVLREVEGLSYEEIAELLDLPLPTVKTRLFRARKTLANVLEGWR
jgi:RNA polymerase sigma-70 factor, ECF subfamily